jgi:Tol biopolymer transport system component
LFVGITGGLGDDGYPMWSPDSKQIAFLSDRSVGIEVYQVKQRNVLKEKTTQLKSKIWSLDLKGSDEVRQISYCPEGVQIKYREPLM